MTDKASPDFQVSWPEDSGLPDVWVIHKVSTAEVWWLRRMKEGQMTRFVMHELLTIDGEQTLGRETFNTLMFLAHTQKDLGAHDIIDLMIESDACMAHLVYRLGGTAYGKSVEVPNRTYASLN